MHLRKMKLVVLSLLSLFMFNAAIFVQTPAETSSTVPISPTWINTESITLILSFDNNQAECTGSIIAAPGTSIISATFKLERYTTSGWKHVKTWNIGTNSNSLLFNEKAEVSTGYTYKLTLITSVIRNGVYENITLTNEDTYY